MTQYSDAPFTFTVGEGLDLTRISHPHATFKQGGYVIDITDLRITSSSTFEVCLTQRQTSMLREGEVKVQLNFFTQEGKRDNTGTAIIVVDENLLKKVLDNE